MFTDKKKNQPEISPRFMQTEGADIIRKIKKEDFDKSIVGSTQKDSQ